MYAGNVRDARRKLWKTRYLRAVVKELDKQGADLITPQCALDAGNRRINVSMLGFGFTLV